MPATSVTEEIKSEELIDDLSNKEVKSSNDVDVDLGKLAALKAKNQAKQENKMAAKIVSKKERSLVLGIIGSGQAGCIDGKTNIYLSNYGITNISNFFYKKLSESNFKNINVTPDSQTCINLQDDNIYTVSIDPETGELKKAKVLAVWKNKTVSKNKITLNNNTYLICSKKHPSLVLRPNSRKKAFFSSLDNSNPLSKGDRLIDSRLNVLDLISEKTYIRDMEITEDIAWLLGAFVGDGHNKLSNNEISFYSDNKEFTNKIINVIKNNIPHTSISLNQRPGCEQISIHGLNARLFFETVFGFDLQSTNGGFGEKTYSIDIPQCISAAKSNIRVAFLAGEIDADGTVCNDWCETSISTSSINLADKIGCLISSIGGRSSHEVILPNNNNNNNNNKTEYRVRLSGKLNHGPLMNDIIRNLSHSSKKERLIKYQNNEQKSFTTSIVPLDFNEVSYWMKSEGKMNTINSLSERSNVSIKMWTNGDRNLSINSFKEVFDSLIPGDQINYIKNISPKLTVIENIENINEEECVFFDLTVDKYENYLAGNNGFIFTHNSRLAESFYKSGYDAVAINTAIQDLKFIDIPDSNKLLLEYGLGGAAKEIEIGKAAAENHRGEIIQLINEKLTGSQVNVLCLSLGGGSGAGSCETLVDILSEMGKPLVVMTVLPMDTEDAQTKANALETLAKLTNLTKTKKISNLVCVDNAKIEAIYHDISQMDFYGTANKAIVDPIDVFNTLSSMPSAVKGLDPMEFGKLFTDGEGLSVYGELTVENYAEDTAIAEAVINNLNNNLLAGGFDLKQSKYVGVIVTANKETWAKIPSSSITYAMAMINDFCSNPKGVFKGIYTVETPDPFVKVYSMFTGLGLPASRVEQLKKDTLELQNKSKNKDENRNLSLQLETNTNETISAAQKIKEKIASKSSAFGKLVGNVVIDRRK